MLYLVLNMCMCIKSELCKHMKNVSPVEMAMGIYDIYIYTVSRYVNITQTCIYMVCI